MSLELQIRLLRRDDSRSEFSCGEPALDRFFREFTGQNQFRLHLSITYIAIIESKILGFATISVGSVERRMIPEDRLCRRLPSYPAPILRLARFGVDKQAQGLGIGKRLLKHIFNLAIKQRDEFGCVGVVTDAKEGAVSFYESLGFKPLNDIREGLSHGDPLPMFLSINYVKKALGL